MAKRTSTPATTPSISPPSAKEFRRPVRMADVAQAAGVARVTVSRALNYPETVAPATLAKVLDTIRHLSYVPDLTAGSLASTRSRIVGAIVPTLSNSWYADTMEGLAAVLGPDGYHLMLAQSSYHPRAEAGLVDAFLGRRVDAIVLTGTTHDHSVRSKLRRLGLPVVETWDLAENPIDTAVGFSNTGTGQAVAAYFGRQGRLRIGFIGAREERSLKRLAGLNQGLAVLGARPAHAELLQPPSSVALGAQALASLLSKHPDIQGIFCSNDSLGAGVLLECRRRDWKVPERMAVIGFSDLAMAEATYPSLTTVRVRAGEIGRQAGQVLLRRFGGEPRPRARAQRVLDVGFEIIARESA